MTTTPGRGGSRARRSAPGPAAALRRTESWLRDHADAAWAAGARKYFRDYDPTLFGVRTPLVRSFASGLAREVKGEWTVREALDFADRCTRRGEMETKFVGWLVLGRWAAAFPPALPARVRRWVLAGLCENWAHIDALSGSVLGPWLERFPHRVREITSWHASKNPWLRRASVVPLVGFARRGDMLEESYEVAETLLADRDDLMHKATGWLLREAGKTDMARLERFLLGHGPRIPRTTLRYAIERFPAARRRALLVETRS